jgi:inositol transport system ATP-binding protein
MLDGQGANARGVFEGEFILEVDHVRKEFPGVVALDDVQLKIRPGTVHALMGENGAGKSTLMKIIAGVYKPDRGEVRFAPAQAGYPHAAGRAEFRHRHDPSGTEPDEHDDGGRKHLDRARAQERLGLIDHGEMARMTQALFDDLNIRLDPAGMVGDLTVAQKQMVEIAKAVSHIPTC